LPGGGNNFAPASQHAMQQTFRIFVFKLIDLYAWIATNTNALAENKTKNLTQSGAHTKDLPAQTFLRVSQTFGTHEKTIYAAVSQHTSHSDQANKQLQTAQLTHANRLAKSMANKAISLAEKNVECQAQIRLTICHIFPLIIYGC